MQLVHAEWSPHRLRWLVIVSIVLHRIPFPSSGFSLFHPDTSHISFEHTVLQRSIESYPGWTESLNDIYIVVSLRRLLSDQPYDGPDDQEESYNIKDINQLYWLRWALSSFILMCHDLESNADTHWAQELNNFQTRRLLFTRRGPAWSTPETEKE